jgi:flagellar assembly protein FliH
MARVIRAARSGPSVVPAALYAAQTDAAQVRARAERDADAMRSQAHADGYAAGRAEAAKQLFDLAGAERELKRKNERDMLQAVLLVAAELMGSTLRAEPETIVALLAPHLTRMQRAQQLVLRLHPDDAGWLAQHESALAQLYQLSQLEGSLELREDAALTRGGCCIESNLGDLDARVETRLTLLAAVLGLEGQRTERA